MAWEQGSWEQGGIVDFGRPGYFWNYTSYVKGLWGQFFFLGNGKTSLDLEGHHCQVNKVSQTGVFLCSNSFTVIIIIVFQSDHPNFLQRHVKIHCGSGLCPMWGERNICMHWNDILNFDNMLNKTANLYMLNGSKRDILDFGVDFWPERIINPSTGETGLRWYWCPYCAPLWGDQCQAARKYSGKFHYQFVVLLNLSSFFIMLYHKKIATNLSFPSQLTMTGKMHKSAYGEWSFKQRVADQILEVSTFCSVCTCFFLQFFLPIFESRSISGL